jgi:hypothetical protein
MKEQHCFEDGLRSFYLLVNGEEQFGGLPSRRSSSDELIWQTRM